MGAFAGDSANRCEPHKDEGCLVAPAHEAASEMKNHGRDDAGDVDRNPFNTAGYLGAVREAANWEAGDGLEQLVETQVRRYRN